MEDILKKIYETNDQMTIIRGEIHAKAIELGELQKAFDSYEKEYSALCCQMYDCFAEFRVMPLLEPSSFE